MRGRKHRLNLKPTCTPLHEALVNVPSSNCVNCVNNGNVALIKFLRSLFSAASAQTD
ncbi:hypothetical protein [Stieleria neptunia]|uniref:hypothetical protein n=1 Tax=Stieleria neptunia TaxID=2527979 RepID=UPI0018D2347D|nr:hypothetical protein [Stieleria neptunia]